MIAVISDIHDNLANLKTALDYAKTKSVSALFVLGDVTNSDTLKYIAKNFADQIYLVSGNMEVNDLEAESKKYKNIKYLGRKGGVIEIAGRTVGLCHEPFLVNALMADVIPAKAGIQVMENSAKRLDSPDVHRGNDKGSGRRPEIIFYGHTHKPWEETKNGVKLVNPGNISNTLYPASFALWNETTNELELKIL